MRVEGFQNLPALPPLENTKPLTEVVIDYNMETCL